MRTKKAGLLTKIVILALLVYLLTAFLNLNRQIAAARSERDAVESMVVSQTQRNAELSEDLAQAGDPKKQEDIARDKLGMVVPGEKVFIDVTN